MKTPDIIKELKRELDMRQKLYPSWVKQMKLTAEQAKHRIDALSEAITILSEKKTEDSQTKLF
jgi:polyhydroxyalkanoate synthesis regulator phasin